MLFDFIDVELQVITVAPFYQALSLTMYITRAYAPNNDKNDLYHYLNYIPLKSLIVHYSGKKWLSGNTSVPYSWEVLPIFERYI